MKNCHRQVQAQRENTGYWLPHGPLSFSTHSLATDIDRSVESMLDERRGAVAGPGAGGGAGGGQAASANNLPFAKGDIVIDSVPTPAKIDKALARLEALARERGSAVGVASAFPASIERIAAWAKAAESRGIAIVPVSGIVSKASSS